MLTVPDERAGLTTGAAFVPEATQTPAGDGDRGAEQAGVLSLSALSGGSGLGEGRNYPEVISCGKLDPKSVPRGDSGTAPGIMYS